MSKLNITAKIWMSIGVFVLGYVLSTILGQIEGVATESTLRQTSEAIFPAAQKTQEAEAAFQRVVKGFADAVVTQDKGGLDRAAEDGQAMLAALNSVAAIPGLPADRSEQVKHVVQSGGDYLTEAHNLYGSVLADPSSMAQKQDQIRALASYRRSENLAR